jgi:acyl-CoA thioester hydrolase
MSLRFPLETRYSDYDTKAHINNAVYLTYFEMARARAWLERVEGDPDFPFVVAEARIRYVSEGMIGVPLDIEITTAEVRNRSWVWEYRIRDVRDNSLIAEGNSVQVMFDYESRKSIPVPDAVRAGLERVSWPSEPSTMLWKRRPYVLPGLRDVCPSAPAAT